MEKEIWKDIPGFIGLYQVSNLGNVRSLDRVIIDVNNISRRMKGRTLKKSISNIYFTVSLGRKNGKPLSFTIHSLVAMAFLNHKVSRKYVIDHVNFNPLDNRVENLKIISQRENLSKDKHRKGKTSKYTGVHFRKDTKKWRACIRVEGVLISLGSYKNEDDATKAYNNYLINKL